MDQFLKADSRTEGELLSILRRFSEAFESHDEQGILELFASDPDLVFLGSSEGPVVGPLRLRALLERIFLHSSASWDFKVCSVSMAGSAAWLTADAWMRANVRGVEINRPYRITAVFEKRRDKWLMMQYHGSEQVKY